MKEVNTEYCLWVLFVVTLVISIKLDMSFISGIVIGAAISRIIVGIIENRNS